MAELKGRKKHLVDGNVAEIKKSEEGLHLERRVGETTNIFSSIKKFFGKKIRDEKK